MKKVVFRKIDGGRSGTDRFLPTIVFNEVSLPEIKEWEIGGEYEVRIKIKMKSKGNVDEFVDEEGGDRLQARFSVEAVGIEDDFEEEYAKRFLRNKK